MQVSFPAGFVSLLEVAYSGINIVLPRLIKLDGLLNAVGKIMIELRVSITIAILAPLNC